jgi:hypothetical protein
MSARMTVVAIRATGHVLGALTELAPGLELTVAAVAGAAMPVQAGTTAFAVPAAQLAVASLAFDTRVFDDPYGARVLFATSSDQSASLAFVNGGAHGELAITADTLTVGISPPPGTPPPPPPPVSVDTPFWVLFQGPAADPPLIVSGVIAKTKAGSDPVAHGLTSGTSYEALVLVSGLGAHQQTVTPP